MRPRGRAPRLRGPSAGWNPASARSLAHLSRWRWLDLRNAAREWASAFAAAAPAELSPEQRLLPAPDHLRPCDRERGHARRARHQGSDQAGGFQETAAVPPAARIPLTTIAWAPCRNRRSRPHEPPRDCRRTAPAPDTDRESGPCSAAARFQAREPSGAVLRKPTARAAAPSIAQAAS